MKRQLRFVPRRCFLQNEVPVFVRSAVVVFQEYLFSSALRLDLGRPKTLYSSRDSFYFIGFFSRQIPVCVGSARDAVDVGGRGGRVRTKLRNRFFPHVYLAEDFARM